jgi:hypothetical protein
MSKSNNNSCENNRLKWLASILNERFGYVFNLVFCDGIIQLRINGKNGLICFDRLEESFYKSSSDIPCAIWYAEEENINSLLGAPLPVPAIEKISKPLIEKCEDTYIIHYDILGLTYWYLSRQEEVGRTDLDDHGRFPATSSHAFKYGYLDRPIIDEWLYILGKVIEMQWPGIELKKHNFNFRVSHDVDIASVYLSMSPYRMIRMIGRILIKEKKINKAINALESWFASRRSLQPDDPLNTFEWIMDVSDKYDLTSAFYFISGRTNKEKDGDYEIVHPAIRSLIKIIYKRGHEIGLHPSYETYQNEDAIVEEAKILKKVCDEEGVKQKIWGGRMHYLRWQHPTTMNGWEKADMTYDSTLCYADQPGFRCGTSYEYPAFDPVSCMPLNLRIRPLVVMDCSIMSKNYLGLGTGDKAFNKIAKLNKTCKIVNGSFTLLWHNSQLTTSAEKELYKKVISFCV